MDCLWLPRLFAALCTVPEVRAWPPTLAKSPASSRIPARSLAVCSGLDWYMARRLSSSFLCCSCSSICCRILWIASAAVCTVPEVRAWPPREIISLGEGIGPLSALSILRLAHRLAFSSASCCAFSRSLLVWLMIASPYRRSFAVKLFFPTNGIFRPPYLVSWINPLLFLFFSGVTFSFPFASTPSTLTSPFFFKISRSS